MKKFYAIMMFALLFSIGCSAQTQSYQQKLNTFLDLFHINEIVRCGMDQGMAEDKSGIKNYEQMLDEMTVAIIPVVKKNLAAQIYSSVSEADLTELNKVLKTPVGQKLVKIGLKEGGLNLPGSENIVMTDADYVELGRISSSDLGDKLEKVSGIVGDAFENMTSSEMVEKILPILSKYTK